MWVVYQLGDDKSFGLEEEGEIKNGFFLSNTEL